MTNINNLLQVTDDVEQNVRNSCGKTEADVKILMTWLEKQATVGGGYLMCLCNT